MEQKGRWLYGWIIWVEGMSREEENHPWTLVIGFHGIAVTTVSWILENSVEILNRFALDRRATAEVEDRENSEISSPEETDRLNYLDWLALLPQESLILCRISDIAGRTNYYYGLINFLTIPLTPELSIPTGHPSAPLHYIPHTVVS